jgi:xylulokinase
VDLLLGIDMGTGSTKGVLVDAAGSVIASETVAHAMNLPKPGWAEVDAEGLWWREVCEVSRKLTAQLPPGGVLSAMCVSGVGPCLVLCDADLKPLRPAILYGVDTRATAEIAMLTAELGRDAILDQAGTLLSSQAVGPKLEWVYRHEPEVFAKAAGWYGSNSYVAAKLTGEYVMDHHTARMCLGRNGSAVTCRCRDWCGRVTSWARCAPMLPRRRASPRAPRWWPARSTRTRKLFRWAFGTPATRC